MKKCRYSQTSFTLQKSLQIKTEINNKVNKMAMLKLPFVIIYALHEPRLVEGYIVYTVYEEQHFYDYFYDYKG